MEAPSLEQRLGARKRPSQIPVMYQKWRDLLFLHWKVNPAKIQKTLPPGLFVDIFQGDAYLTVAPFFMKLFGFSFIGVNVRTYVYDKNRTPGVWFYSLNLNGLLTARLAKTLFKLPYVFAEIERVHSKNQIVIQGKRPYPSPVLIDFAYQSSVEKPHLARPHTLEFFLIERYVLFTFHSQELKIGRVHHPPYPLQSTYLFEYRGDLLRANGFHFDRQEPDAIHYSPGVDAAIFLLKSLDTL